MITKAKRSQSGIAMVAVLVMMVAIALFGAAVMNMSGLEQRIAGNFQLVAESFEVSEAGLRAAVSLAESGATTDPFQGPGATLGSKTLVVDPDQTAANAANPFFGDNPIQSLAGQSDLGVVVHLVGIDQLCPRSATATSTSISKCDYYRLDSSHEHANTGVVTGVELHVVEEVTASN